MENISTIIKNWFWTHFCQRQLDFFFFFPRDDISITKALNLSIYVTINSNDLAKPKNNWIVDAECYFKLDKVLSSPLLCWDLSHCLQIWHKSLSFGTTNLFNFIWCLFIFLFPFHLGVTSVSDSIHRNLPSSSQKKISSSLWEMHC